MTIRPCTREDIDAVAAIYRPAVLTGTASFELEPPDSAEMAARWSQIVGAGYPYLVATQHDGVAGYAYASAFRPRPAYRWAVEDSVYVRPDAQRRGVGDALLRALIDECAQRGFRQMMAVIGDSASLGSIALHRRCGFVDAGVWRASGWKFGRWLDSVIMQRPLGAGDSAPPTAPV